MIEKSAAVMNRRTLAKSIACGVAASILPPLPATGEQRRDEDLAEVQFANQQWSEVYPGVWCVRIGKPEVFTPVSTRFVAPAEGRLREMTAPSTPPLPSSKAKIERRGTTVLLDLEAGENLYGLGLQMLSFNQRGKKKTLRVNADPRVDSGDSHAPVPFYVSAKGYGIFVDTARYATFCMGTARLRGERTADQRISFLENAPKLENDQHANVTVQIDGAPGVDIYLFAGPTMLDAVRRYNLFSGGGVNPPEWGLGFWYRAQAKASGDEVLRFAKEFRERKIPCDVMGLEPGWQTHAYSCSFVFDGKFPDPEEFVRELGALNYHVNLWEHAFVHPSAPFHDEIKRYSGDYQVWGGLAPDFQSTEARRIFGEHHRKNFVDIGVSGFKLDECDNSDFTGGWSFPEFSHFPSGQDGEQMHSVFGLRYQQTLMEQFDDAKKPTYGLVRSSGALAAPYPFALYSDLYDHRAFVRSLVNSGFSGLLWCPEVRDARGPNDLIRRLQTVVFSPLAMVNAWYIANPPWKQQDRKKNNANQLEVGWEKLEVRCREIIEWRMLLIPYLRSAFASYAHDATPPFRALLMEDASDSALRNCDDQFMVGDRMMVAPLFDGEPERKVILPRGAWCDFWTGEAVGGGRTITVPASYERIPVYVKSGSVIPLGGIANSTAEAATRRLTVKVFGDGSLPFSIGAGTDRELLLTWESGKGSMKQSKVERPYSVAAWKKAADV